MQEKVKIGVCGMGMGKNHAYAAHVLANTEIVAIADMNPDCIASAKESLKNKEKKGDFLDQVQLYTDYKKMIVEGGIDAIVIALPTHLHTEASIFALDHGLHVLCEKPPTVTVEEMKSVYDKVKETGLTYSFARQMRFSPKIQTAKNLVENGELGQVYHAEAKWCRTGNIPFRLGYGVNKDTGGGVLLDLGIHEIDNAWFSMGCPQPVEVMSIMHCAFPHLGDSKNLDVPYTADDMTQGLIRFENGASLSFNVTFAFNAAGLGNKEIENEGKAEWNELSIYGEKAGINMHQKKIIKRIDKSLEVSVSDIEYEDAHPLGEMAAQLDNFANAILTKTEPQNNVEQAVHLMQILDALFTSAETKKSITIEKLGEEIYV